MGGWGSSRWGSHSKKNTVEDALTLKINRLKRDGLLAPNSYNLSWSRWTGEKTASISYTIANDFQGSSMGHLKMTMNYLHGAEKMPVTFDIRVEATRPNWGGVRYFFNCPLIVNGIPCNRRVTKLHSAGGCKYFGCRHCLNLTYNSSQTHTKKFDFLNRLQKYNPLGYDLALESLLKGVGKK